jgi:hypothetical protein
MTLNSGQDINHCYASNKMYTSVSTKPTEHNAAFEPHFIGTSSDEGVSGYRERPSDEGGYQDTERDQAERADLTNGFSTLEEKPSMIGGVDSNG